MKLSIIIPVYNSAKILPELTEQIVNNLKNKITSFEIYFINDCSNDNSWNIIVNLSKKYSWVKGINLKNNYGQHNAVMAGLNLCNGDDVILMDDDLQHDPKYIYEIYLQLQSSYDACYVNYLNRKHKLWKKAVSWINNLICSFLINKPIKIYTSSFKGIKKKVVKKMILFKEKDSFLDWLVFANATKVTIIDVEHQERHSGNTTYSLVKLLYLWSSMIMIVPLKTRLSTFIPLAILKILVKICYLFSNKKINTEQYIISDTTY